MSNQCNAKKKPKIHFTVPNQGAFTTECTPVKKWLPKVQTPHLNKGSTMLKRMDGSLAANVSKVRDVGEANTRNKGCLLTYFCTGCNIQHFFHKGDIIKVESPLLGRQITSTTERRNETEECVDDNDAKLLDEMNTSAEQLEVAGTSTKLASQQDNQYSGASGSDDSLPEIDFTYIVPVCCAESRCVRPNFLLGMVRCYDCKGLFHQNHCGDAIQLLTKPGQEEKTRHICLQCYRLCCSGREVCKHPAQKDGRIPCMTCYRKFHEKGCGGGITKMRMSCSSDVVVDCLMCYSCRMTRGKGHSFESLVDENLDPNSIKPIGV
jgi:hypothetical protein